MSHATLQDGGDQRPATKAIARLETALVRKASDSPSGNGAPVTIAPYNLDAERAVVGAMVLNRQALEIAVQRLDGSDFHQVDHRRIFRTAVRLRAAGSPVDLVTVCDELRRTGELRELGSEANVAAICEAVPGLGNVGYYCQIVARESRRRDAIEILEDALRDCRDPNEAPDEALGRAQERLSEICDPRSGHSAPALETINLGDSWDSGVEEVDWILPGWLVFRDIGILAGPAGVGKSTTAYDLAIACATGKLWCGIATARPLRVRVVDEEQGSNDVIRMVNRLLRGRGFRTREDLPGNLLISSGQGLRLSAPYGLARLKRDVIDNGIELLVIDSVQQVFGVDENDAGAVGDVFSQLFQLRDEHGLTIVLVHHRRKLPQNKGPVDPLDLVRGSTAFTTQTSTVWTAESPTPGILELRQSKRRGATRTSLRISYTEDCEGKAITLGGEGGVESADTVQARAELIIQAHLQERREARRTDLIGQCTSEGIAGRTAERALRHLADLGVVHNVKRGLWALISQPRLREEVEEV